MGFFRQEHRSGLPFPSPGDLPDPGIKSGSPALQADASPLSHQGNQLRVSSVQSSSVAQSCPTLSDPMDCSTPGLPVHHQFKLMSIESVMPSNHLILCCCFSSCPQSFAASGSFQMSQFFASSGQSIVVRVSMDTNSSFSSNFPTGTCWLPY